MDVVATWSRLRPRRGRSRVTLFTNATDPLELPTYDGSGQCVHPDVIEVRGLPSPRYLMVAEPYPYADATYENPSLFESADGLRWKVPEGVVNPIVSRPAERGAWNSDADIAALDGGLTIHFRRNSGAGETTLLRVSSADGRQWGSPESLRTFPVSGSFASPSLIRGPAGLELVYVDTLAHEVRTLVSNDGEHWRDGRPLVRMPGAWHVDSLVVGDHVFLLLTDQFDLYVLRSRDCVSWESPGPAGEAWEPLQRVPAAPLLAPSLHGWDDSRIYRASGVWEGQLLHVWYSAVSRRGEWRIGYTAGRLPE